MICAKFGWNWPSGSGEEDFLNFSMYFRNFVIISPGKRARPFIWTNLNSLYLRMHCANFDWNWPNGSVEEDGNVKSLRQQRQQRQRQRRTTYKFWSEKLTWAFGSGELKKRTRISNYSDRPRRLANYNCAFTTGWVNCYLPDWNDERGAL